MNERDLIALPWLCPECKGTYEISDVAWRAFDPLSPAFCPDDACGAELGLNL